MYIENGPVKYIENMIDAIKRTAKDLIDNLENVRRDGAKHYFQHDFDCSFFKNWSLSDIRNSTEHKELFEKLGGISGPVVYWFEIIEPIDNDLIRQSLSHYKYSEGAKSVPALKSRYSRESTALYVGKVKRKFWGRVIQHLGYYHVKRTQGLQLYHWAKDLELKVRLHAYEFEQNMEDLVSIFELDFARKLKPITGKHT